MQNLPGGHLQLFLGLTRLHSQRLPLLERLRDTQLTKPGRICTTTATTAQGFVPGAPRVSQLSRFASSRLHAQRLHLLERLRGTQLTKPDGICTTTADGLYQERLDLVNCHNFQPRAPPRAALPRTPAGRTRAGPGADLAT